MHATSATELCAVMLGMGMTVAQDFPTKPIRLVTSNAGGGNDFVGRP